MQLSSVENNVKPSLISMLDIRTLYNAGTHFSSLHINERLQMKALSMVYNKYDK
jgi:hypothetical protein